MDSPSSFQVLKIFYYLASSPLLTILALYNYSTWKADRAASLEATTLSHMVCQEWVLSFRLHALAKNVSKDRSTPRAWEHLKDTGRGAVPASLLLCLRDGITLLARRLTAPGLSGRFLGWQFLQMCTTWHSMVFWHNVMLFWYWCLTQTFQWCSLFKRIKSKWLLWDTEIHHTTGRLPPFAALFLVAMQMPNYHMSMLCLILSD